MTLPTTYRQYLQPKWKVAPAAVDLEPLVQLEDVAVRYRMPRERVTSLKDYALRWLRGRIRYSDVWALRAVNLAVYPGEAVGIVGPNGAGKSTLLKVVARVLRPTDGRARVWGDVAPILELGAGFDPELTGRENIYLNGAMLGFPRREMDKKINAVLDFAQIGAFIDAPLRTYSDGMIARLGFAVATDVTPDLLLMDEALMVGDKEFQQKCLKRLRAFQNAGATFLVVSHNLQTIQELCSRAIWFSRGKIAMDGDPIEVINAYMNTTECDDSISIPREF